MSPTLAAPESKPTTITGNTRIVNCRGGDVIYHSDVHVHVHEPARQETVVIRRDVHFVPPRPVDPKCEQLAREHEERMRRCMEFPLGE